MRSLSDRDLERRLMHDGDLILERSGGGPGTPVGRIALIEGLGVVYCNNFCQQLRVDKTICEPRYAVRALWHRYTQGITARLEHQTTGIRNLDYAGYLAIPILLPPLHEQQAIAEILDSIDDAIESSEAAIAATEQLRDSLLHELLTRGVPGWHTEWKQARGIGEVPADWRVARLGEVAEVNQANWNPDDGTSIRYLDLTAVSAPGVLQPPREIDAVDAPSRARRRVRSGDILVSTVRPNLRGFARVHDASENLIASTGFAVLTVKECVDKSFVYHNIMTHRFADYLERSTTGQAYPAVRSSDIEAFALAIPPLSEQQTIAAMLDSVDAAVERSREERDMLESLKASTADVLLTGRTRVGSTR